MTIADFLSQDYVKEELKKNNLETVYQLAAINWSSQYVEPDLTRFFIENGINPNDYFTVAIPDRAFLNMVIPTPFKINDSVELIGRNAFYDCSLEDEDIILPKNLKKIEDRAFGENIIRSIELPATIKELSRTAFDEGVDVYIPKSCKDDILENFGASRPKYNIIWE